MQRSGGAPEIVALRPEVSRVAVTADRPVGELVFRGATAGGQAIRRTLEFRADPTDVSFDTRLGERRRVLLYCTDGRRSELAAHTMSSLGYADVAYLEGGTHAWSRAGLPLYGAQSPVY